MTDTNQLPPHTITIRDHPEPHIMQWSDLELAAVKRYAEQYALQARAQVQGEREAFEAFAQNCPMGKYSSVRRGDGYDSSHTQLMWDAWQARAILAPRPERVPMTDEQVDSFRVDGRLHWLGKRQLIRAVEAYYGITTKAKKEGA